MNFERLMRARRMTRSFTEEPLPEGLVDQLLDTARRVPSAGFSQGFDFLVLDGPEQAAQYWNVTLPGLRRSQFRWQGLLRAPLIVVVYADSQRYISRYGDVDKHDTGLGVSRDHWSTPYWLVDASFAAFALQLASIDAGLGVLFFGLFDEAEAVARAFGVPTEMEAVGALAIGYPDDGDQIGRSARRPRRRLGEMVHRGSW